MPSEFVNVPEETDPDVIAQDIYDYLETRAENWVPRDTEFDTWMINAAARILATLKDTASEARVAVFRYLGAFVYNIPPIAAQKATSKTTWQLIDNEGHTIPAGTFVGVPNAGGELIPFETIENVVIPAGKTATALGEVVIQAVSEGDEANNIGTGGSICILEDQYPWVASKGITLTETTHGGQDEESDIDYLNRLVAEIRLWAPRPITPQNFATMARDTPGIGRCLAVNLYNPVTKTYGNEKTITLVVEDGEGHVCPESAKKELKEFLTAQREVNFVVFVIDPSYNLIDVNFEVTAWQGWDKENVRQQCIAALEEFLKSNTWGRPPFGDKDEWYNRETISENDLVAVLGAVQGVKDVVKVTLALHTKPLETKDITLVGVGALAQSGTLTGTVL